MCSNLRLRKGVFSMSSFCAQFPPSLHIFTDVPAICLQFTFADCCLINPHSDIRPLILPCRKVCTSTDCFWMELHGTGVTFGCVSRSPRCCSACCPWYTCTPSRTRTETPASISVLCTRNPAGLTRPTSPSS